MKEVFALYLHCPVFQPYEPIRLLIIEAQNKVENCPKSPRLMVDYFDKKAEKSSIYLLSRITRKWVRKLSSFLK
jgi:hypothetical protein